MDEIDLAVERVERSSRPPIVVRPGSVYAERAMSNAPSSELECFDYSPRANEVCFNARTDDVDGRSLLDDPSDLVIRGR